jgi:hypothetical protein
MNYKTETALPSLIFFVIVAAAAKIISGVGYWRSLDDDVHQYHKNQDHFIHQFYFLYQFL